MRRPKEDPQQYRVYAWENALTNWAGAHATSAQMRRAVERCCRIYRVPVPQLSFATKDRRDGKLLHSAYDPGKHTIVFRPRHMDVGSAIHEATHSIVDWIMGPWGSKAHGREFVGVYIWLLAKLKVLPRPAMVAWARSMRIQMCSPAMVAPRHIRARFKSKVKNAKRERRMLRLWQ